MSPFRGLPSLRGILCRTGVGLPFKSFLRLGCSTSVVGLPILLDALRSDSRNNGRGVITVSNHISTIDDPLVWGVLPTHYFFTSRLMRWTLGASEIMFTNPVFSSFFRHGQVIETFRGRGIFQPAVGDAIRKLDNGDWIHLFPESKVTQSNAYPDDGSLPRFKWGTGRIVMSTTKMPVIVPMWITGFDHVMPEGRTFPWKYLPRWRQRLTVTFGNPVDPNELSNVIDKASNEIECRTRLTTVIQHAVESLGKTAPKIQVTP